MTIRTALLAACLCFAAAPVFAAPVDFECKVDRIERPGAPAVVYDEAMRADPGRLFRFGLDISGQSGCIRDGINCSKDYEPLKVQSVGGVVTGTSRLISRDMPVTLIYNSKTGAFTFTADGKMSSRMRDCKTLPDPDDPDAPPKLWKAAEGKIKWNEASDQMPDSDLIILGRLAIVLEQSTMADLARATGGTLRQSGDASTSLRWLCLHLDDTAGDVRLWLTSDEMMGGERINGVMMARLPASAKAAPACPAIKPEHAAIRLPGNLKLGEAEAAVRSRLGKTSYDSNGIVAFSRTFELAVPPPHGPCNLSLSAWFRMEGGVVTALSIGRGGGC